MAKKETSSGSDKSLKTVAGTGSLQPQNVSEENKKMLAKRTAEKGELSALFNEKMGPMLGKVIKRKNTGEKSSRKGAKASGVKTSSAESGASAPAAESRENVFFIESAGNPSTVEFSSEGEVFSDEIVEETDGSSTKEEGSGFFGLSFDWKEFDGKVLDEMIGFFNKSTREETEKEAPVEPEGPMVIVADFTLPYRCCEDYVCEDMCYTDGELAALAIPPFAKDDFAVTRKNTKVEIYPDLNDSHLFKDAIVVKEIENEEKFETAAGGKVTTDKGGEHPHFIYSPPADKAGVSDSFIYTLYNTKNGLSDTATVWIEVAEALPSMSVKNTTVCRNAGLQEITVDANDNPLENIQVNGRGIEMLVDTGTGERSWTFNPKGVDVFAGMNEITLTLEGEEVQTLNITVNEIVVDFSEDGELVDIDPISGMGTVLIHDQSLNLNKYEWEWSLDSEKINTSEQSPEEGVVTFPLEGAPREGDFTLFVTLTGTTPEGCTEAKTKEIRIAGFVREEDKPLRSIEIVKQYTIELIEKIPEIDPAFRIIVDPSDNIYDELEVLMREAEKQVADNFAISIIDDGGFDNTIELIGLNIRKMLPANTPTNSIPKDDAYMEVIFTASVITYALLAIRDTDVNSNPKLVGTVNIALGSISNLINAGYGPPPLLIRNIDSMQLEFNGKPVLQDKYNKMIQAFGQL